MSQLTLRGRVERFADEVGGSVHATVPGRPDDLGCEERFAVVVRAGKHERCISS